MSWLLFLDKTNNEEVIQQLKGALEEQEKVMAEQDQQLNNRDSEIDSITSELNTLTSKNSHLLKMGDKLKSEVSVAGLPVVAQFLSNLSH